MGRDPKSHITHPQTCSCLIISKAAYSFIIYIYYIYVCVTVSLHVNEVFFEFDMLYTFLTPPRRSNMQSLIIDSAFVHRS